jgi:hypothetical protein
MTGVHRTLDSNPELSEAAAGSPTFAKLARDSKRVTIQGRTLYVVEGDLLLDEVQLAEYALRKESGEDEGNAVAEAPTGDGPAKLLGISVEGKTLRWQPGKVLSYYIAKESFPTTEMYQTVRDRTQEAAEDWMDACGIQFEYQPSLDENPTGRTSALFGVFHLDVNGQFIAAAFFPDDPADRRTVIIDPSFFSPNLRFDKTGVLRHELGHVLGFRHEHIRSGAPAVCPGEPLYDTVELTEYDPRSVMHYFCGNVGSNELEITELDRSGSQRLYGGPYSAFNNIA